MRARYVVMGAGEVGFHLARSLSQEGHNVVVIESDPAKRERIEEHLDVSFVAGNGAHVPILQAASVGGCELFLAVSSSDEANLAASALAKQLGAQRSVVRVGVAEDVTEHRRVYEDVFKVDLLLSTELLATTQILNHILGHNTVAVEYLANGRVQLRKIQIEKGSVLTRHPLREVKLPRGCLVVAFFRGDELIIPSGRDRAEPGDHALVLGHSEVIGAVERKLSATQKNLGTVVIAGGGSTGYIVAQALRKHADRIKIIEQDRTRAELLADNLPWVEVLHGDVTDISLLRAEHIAEARSFVALSGNDESNLMASLLAQELKVPQVIARVEHAETSHLWQRLGLMCIVSPRTIAYERIKNYIHSGFSANILSLHSGAAQVMERRLQEASPAAGVTLAEMNPPRGLIVGTVVRGERVFVPGGRDRLEVGDTVILFASKEEVPTVQLFFPGKEPLQTGV